VGVVCCADRLCGGVAACLGVAWVLCAVQIGYVVVWQHVLGVACVLCVVQNKAQYKLPDDGRRPKQVGAIFVQILDLSKFNKQCICW
jgi:hypothetical protein